MKSALIALLLASTGAAAQEHRHVPGMTHPSDQPPMTEGGQAAFAAIAEVIRLLEADSTTDWSRVNLEALRQHLIDMDEVTLRGRMVSAPIDRGVRVTYSGVGRTLEAIRRMVVTHATVVNAMPGLEATAAVTPTGARLTVLARDPADRRTVARLRGLGGIGVLALGGHHGPHHLAIARGDANAHAH